MIGEKIIEVTGLTKSFGAKTVVQDVALTVRRGQIYGFLGPNGSGKTTTIRMLCGLLTPDSGQGQCLGYDIIKDAAKIKREVGYMTQKFSFWDDLTIRENLDFVARVYAIPDRVAKVDAALDRLGLAGRQHQQAGALSGGWKQRMALAACILHSPQLLLLDEPTAGVDPKARREFWDEIHALAADGLTVLVSTHYMDEAERCHEIAYIAYGRLLTTGTVDEILEQSGLVTWEVEGAGLTGLARRLTGLPGIQMVAPFGASLHISGTERERMAESLRPFQAEPALTWHEAKPTLEDVFIQLMGRATDNFQ